MLAASADEPLELNFVRKHALDSGASTAAIIETAALRVFGNADGAYGANVNQLVDDGALERRGRDSPTTFARRKGFAYGRDGRPRSTRAAAERARRASTSPTRTSTRVELGVTTVDHYFDTLGGISRAVRAGPRRRVGAGLHRRPDPRRRHRAHARRAGRAGDPHPGAQPEMVRGLLKHGYEGVRQIEAHVTNTLGWSATTGQVAPWVYQQTHRRPSCSIPRCASGSPR